MQIISYISILLEVVVVFFSLKIAIVKKQTYGWALAVTFIIYIFYDLARVQNWSTYALYLVDGFLAASISAVVATYLLYKKEK
jgi:hypothetical protein